MSRITLKPLKKREAKKAYLKKETPFLDYIKKHFSLLLALKFICAFLLSRAAFIGGAQPLGYALFAAGFGLGGAYICAAGAILGLVFSKAGILTIGKYIISVIMFSLIFERFLPEKFKQRSICALTGSLCVLVSGVFLLFADVTVGGYPLLYDVVVLIVESATLYGAIRAFSLAMPLLFSLKLRRSLRAEETVSLAILTGGIICGFGTFNIGGVFSVSGTLCVLCVLAFSISFGALHGCGAGIIMGMVCCVSRGRIDACAASFALCGLCAGYFSKYGKWAACMSFIMANAAVTILSNGSTEVLINIFDTALAAALLYAMPKKVFDALHGFSSESHTSFSLAASKLKSAQSTINDCEKSFRRIFELRNNNELNSLALYRRTARNVCSNCGLRKYCWGRDAKATKESMDFAADKLKNSESLTVQDAPAHCLRGEQFAHEFTRMFEVYKNDCYWTEKISEFRGAVYDSFNGIAALLGKSADRLSSSPQYDYIASDDIRCRLKKEGIHTHSVYVSGEKEDTCVRIKLENCGGFGRCEGAVCKILESSLGMPFVRTGLRSCGECTHTYVVKPSFSITAAVAGAIKANKKVSGDYALYALVDRHTYALILCDGMGSGETAREESRCCARLLMRLLESGIDAQSAINIINSMLLCAFSGTLAAIDLCLINLDDASSRLYKCGGAVTYAKTPTQTLHISPLSLPAGSFVPGDTAVYTIDSARGSMVVLVSDGVSSSETSRLPWIKNMIESFDGTEPEALAHMILKRAKELSSSAPSDDLTVLAAHIG